MESERKIFWFEGGDLNTRYFHASATSTKRKNKINQLKDDSNIVFKPVISTVRSKLNDSDNMLLLSQFKAIMFSMHYEKSLGPDGLNLAFYHRFLGSLE